MSSDGTGGLGRFVRPREAADDRPLPPGLKRFLETRAPAPAGERCELCNERIAEEHPHVVNIESRALLCSCRPCYLLFTVPGAARGKYASVPDRHLYDPEFTLSHAEWEELQIPVRMAFFFVNSRLGQTVAFYPSPAGATESLLPLETWDRIMAANPLFSSLTPDVEALLVCRRDDRYECYLAPIDACYELAGRLRTLWQGFDGGPAARKAIDAYFEGIEEKAR